MVLKFQTLGRLVIFPRVFAEGTKTKPYSSITVDTTDLPAHLSQRDPSYHAHPGDLARVPAKADWRYLVECEHQPGPVHIAFRGKTIAFTVGVHILVLHFGLEASMRIITLQDFNEIVSNCVPGPNKNRAKANRLRSFPLPQRFIVPGSAQTDRYINIFAAIIMGDHAIIFSDFSRLMRMHVISGPCVFTRNEIEPGSLFPSGPDWVCERPAAIRYMHTWCQSVLENDICTPMIDVLTEVDGPGAGIGQHLANDLLFLLAIHPDTPAIELCVDAALYDRLADFLPVFMAHWFSPEFLKRCGGRVNSTNPFAFNSTSDSNFRLHEVHVFRKAKARVEANLFNLYQSQGFLDPEHVIGVPFNLYTQQSTLLPVRHHRNGTNRYHIFQAQVPPYWRQNDGDAAIADIADTGYTTTVGVASFREVLSNKINPEHALKTCLRPGRPKTVCLLSSLSISY
ncbi:hypothetical protein B0H10DRAFT_1836644 [Mycena sp. CBHHK59/15]|nr:hypothetical protein B0H10DRAFT_1853292 [Mycena sp. CBHHK59/15]KAJ6576789.1 hypothetical protein B0H10DRAFT_1836644 [Mycena sp. CBHHK59/15]